MEQVGGIRELAKQGKSDVTELLGDVKQELEAISYDL